MTLHQAVYDGDLDKLYVWHGVYERFNLVNDPATVMWIYSWYICIEKRMLIVPDLAHALRTFCISKITHATSQVYQ